MITSKSYTANRIKNTFVRIVFAKSIYVLNKRIKKFPLIYILITNLKSIVKIISCHTAWFVEALLLLNNWFEKFKFPTIKRIFYVGYAKNVGVHLTSLNNSSIPIDLRE